MKIQMPRGNMPESWIMSLRSGACASCQAVKRTIQGSGYLQEQISSGTDKQASKKNAGDLKVSGVSI